MENCVLGQRIGGSHRPGKIYGWCNVMKSLIREMHIQYEIRQQGVGKDVLAAKPRGHHTHMESPIREAQI